MRLPGAIRRAVNRYRNQVRLVMESTLGYSSKGTVYRASVSRKGRKRYFALKTYDRLASIDRRFGIRKKEGRLELQNMHVLKKLGFPTVPVLGVTRAGLLMKDLTEGGKCHVFDFQNILMDRNWHGRDTDVFREYAKASNANELEKEYEKINALAKRHGIGLGSGGNCIFIVIDRKTKVGKIVIADFGDADIPKVIMQKFGK